MAGGVPLFFFCVAKAIIFGSEKISPHNISDRMAD
jgi:hypothetical protein